MDVSDMDRQCRLCALKHMAEATAVLKELKLGYYSDAKHRCYCMGELCEAETHLARIEPALAERVRELRLLVFEVERGVSKEALRLADGIWTDLEAAAVSTSDLRPWNSVEKGIPVGGAEPGRCRCGAGAVKPQAVLQEN